MYGIVDIGSNSIRLSIYKTQGKDITPLINKKEMAGLAEYVGESGALLKDGAEKACDILLGFKEILDKFGVEEKAYFATASLRNISNRDEVVDFIYRKTGIVPEVISGEEEARLDFIGITHSLSVDQGVVVDIGGGSTEVVYFQEKKIKKLTSLPIGSLNLYRRFVKRVLPEEQERKRIKREIKMQFEELDWAVEKPLMLCGVGGTLRAALKINRELFPLYAGSEEMPAKNIRTILNLLSEKDDRAFQAIYRTVPERLLSIIPGLMILKQAIKKFGVESITVSKNGVREGYLIDRFLI